MPLPLTSIQLEFIFDNKDKMRQVEIAKALNVSPAVINQKLRGRKAKVIPIEGYFDIDKEWKRCYNY